MTTVTALRILGTNEMRYVLSVDGTPLGTPCERAYAQSYLQRTHCAETVTAALWAVDCGVTVTL